MIKLINKSSTQQTIKIDSKLIVIKANDFVEISLDSVQEINSKIKSFPSLEIGYEIDKISKKKKRAKK